MGQQWFIIYCESKDCCYSGINLIPSKIIEYNYNDQWVIAKSISKGKITYWLLNKEIKFNKNDSINKTVNTYLSAPLDSIRFYEELRSRNIHLKLKKYDANIWWSIYFLNNIK